MKFKDSSNILLKKSPFYELKHWGKLRFLLSKKSQPITKNQIKKFIYLTSQYTINTIYEKRKEGKIRTLDVPHKDLRPVLKKISNILKHPKVPDRVYGIIKENGKIKKYKDLQNTHSQNKEVWYIDIVNYTHSIEKDRVFDFFDKRLKCNSDIANILTKLCITSYNKIPVGAPHSNYLSYYVVSDMWDEIFKIAIENKYDISLYKDDLILSGKKMDKDIIERIKAIITNNKFKYHKEQFMSGEKYTRLVNNSYGYQYLNNI